MRDSLQLLRSQSWFVLIVLGMGVSFSLIETHRQLLINDMIASYPIVLFIGHAIPPVFFLIRFMVKPKRTDNGYAFFSKRPLLVAIPVGMFSAGVLLIALAANQTTTDTAVIFATFLIGFSVTALPFAWIELLVSIDGKLAVIVSAIALICCGLIHLIITSLCQSIFSIIVLAFSSLLLIGLYREACIQKELATRRGTLSRGPLDNNLGSINSAKSPAFALPLLIMFYFFAFSCLFADGDPRPIDESTYALGQLFSVLGILLCGTIICVLVLRIPTRRHSSQVFNALIFLVMIICFLCAFLLGDSIIAALPLYTARELIFILLFWSAFTVDTRAAKMGQFALTMTFWVSSWFIYYFLRWGLDMLGLPSIAILGVLSLIILMAIAIYIFLGLVRGLGKDEGKSVTNGLDLSKASEGKAAVVDRLSIEFKLTERERELFPFLMTGLSAEYIAEKFTISPATVRTHAHNIYSKAGVSSQRKLIELVDPLIQQNDRERL